VVVLKAFSLFAYAHKHMTQVMRSS